MDVLFNVPEVGDLTHEHTFYMLGYDPNLFVCKDAKGSRFLCSCYHLADGWVIGRVEERALIDMIDDKITIREVFEQSCGPKWHVTWNGKSFSFETEVPSDIFPQEGALLELEHDKTVPYRKVLQTVS